MTPAVLLLLLFNEEGTLNVPLGDYLWITNLGQRIKTSAGQLIIFNKGA